MYQATPAQLPRVLRQWRCVSPGFVCRLLFVSIFLAGSAFAGPDRWIVGIEKEIKPLSYVDEKGAPQGYVVELLKEIAREQNISVEFQAETWSQLYARFLAGEIDVLGAAAFTRERVNQMMYSEAHTPGVPVLFIRNGITLTSMTQMQSLRIAAMSGSRSYEYLQAHGFERQIRFTDSTEDGLRMIERGEVDGYIDLLMIGAQLIKDCGLRNVRISDIVLPEISLNLHFAVRNGDRERLDILNTGLALTIRSGVMADLRKKWIEPHWSKRITWKELKPYVLVGGPVLLLLILAVYRQNCLLRRLKTSESALKRSSGMLEMAQEIAHIGGWQMGLRDDSLTMSKEAYRMLDLDPDSFKPSIAALLELFPAKDRETVLGLARAAKESRMPGEVEVTATTPKGRNVTLRIIAHLEAGEGQVEKMWGSIQDVTEDRKAEQERNEMQKKLLNTQRLESLGVLAGGIAHDFNNLLTVILTNASFLKGDASLAEDGKTSVDQIELAARRAAELCREMHAYSGRATIDHRPLDLRQLFGEIHSLLALTAGKRVKLVLNLPEGLPPVMGDASQLRQVVLNLVQNASESISHNEGVIQVSLDKIRIDETAVEQFRPTYEISPGDFILLCVRDNGSGMDASIQKRIFEPFFTTKFTGRGLGLSAVHGIARAHAAAVEVTTTVGKGSVFSFLIPCILPGPSETPSVEPSNTVPEVSFETPALLLADDDQPIRQTLSMLLRRKGHEVIEASDGLEAARLFSEQPNRFKAAVLDITMPGKTGIQVLEEIRHIKPSMPVLIISGFSTEDHMRFLQNQPHLTFLAKPFTHEAFLQSLRRLMED